MVGGGAAAIPIVITFRRSQTLKILFGSINIFHFQMCVNIVTGHAHTHFSVVFFTIYIYSSAHRKHFFCGGSGGGGVATLTLKQQKIAFSPMLLYFVVVVVVHCHYARTRTIRRLPK